VRNELLESQIFYPHTAGNAHHRAARSVIEKTWGWKNRGGKSADAIEWKKLERKLSSNDGTAIISSEFFSEADQNQLANLTRRLDGVEVEVIFTWRPLPFMLASSYQQYLKYGLKKSYGEWLDSIFEVPGEAKFTPSFWKRNLHGDVVARWAETFGAENVSLIAVDESNPGYLYETFAELAGIPKGILREPAHLEMNRSLTFTEAALLLEINRTYPKDLDWDSYEIFIRKGNIKALTSSDKHEGTDEKILTPEWAIAKAAELNLQNVAKIKSLGIKVIGNLDRSDFSKIPTGLNAPVTTISIETVARSMIGVDMSSLHKMHGKAISKEFFHRAKRALKRRLHLN
jgi:hypothetical protein